MPPFIWTAEHCQALREYRARGLSYGEITRRLNSKFGTAYTRNAALGRGRAHGACKSRPVGQGGKASAEAQAAKAAEMAWCCESVRSVPRPNMSSPLPRLWAPSPSRRVGITPRLISLIELGPNDCRYPYGGDKDGEAITFCGPPKRPGSNYCEQHFHLTRGDGVPSERQSVAAIRRPI